MKEKIKENKRISWREYLGKKIELRKIKKKIEGEGKKIKKVAIKWGRKVRTSRNGIFIALLISASLIGTDFGVTEYQKTSELLKVAGELTKEEKYDEAIEKLELAKISWFVDNVGMKKQEISKEIEENKKLDEDKSKYTQGLNEFNEGNLHEAIDLLSELPLNSFYYQRAQTKIEEAKRKTVEGELSKETVARKNAEAKAKQEEFEKKLKEQQLADKEAEEKMMNADNDADSLTYRRELELGTSDWDTDSDSDGIIDSKDIHPAGGGRNMPQTFTWSYGGYNWTWTESIQEDWYDYYKAKPRSSPESVEYITSDDPFIKKISKKISEGAKQDVPKTWLAVSFVQSLSYVDDMYTGYDEYPKYPVETFFEKNGDCEDTSYLATSIINAMDISSVLILLPGHMAIGVWMECNTPGTYYKWSDRCYYYVETTGEGWSAGEIPDGYRYLSATLIRVPSGETINNISPQYKKPCNPSPDFSGYYSDGKDFYSDSQCNNLTYCLPYKDLYYYYPTKDFYWDSSCTQKVVSWCSKSTYHPGYFFNSLDYEYYYDYRCIQKADL